MVSYSSCDFCVAMTFGTDPKSDLMMTVVAVDDAPDAHRPSHESACES